MRRQKHYSKKSMASSTYSSTSPLFSQCTWVPLTLIFLLYTSGLTIGESTSDGAKSDPGDDGEKNETINKKNYTLTGNPQIDYVHDPNLPRELNGYNLSNYPFLNRVPSNINFSCEGLKDGFYASIEHKCQLYHHCLFGTRYDFLCANYTAFDQKTFICQFVSDIDCPNSALFFHRNNDLYVQSTTTPPPRPYRRPGLYDRKRPTKNPDKYESPAGSAARPDDGTKFDKDPPQAVDDVEGGGAAGDESDEDYRAAVVPRRKRCRRKCRNRGRRCIQRCQRQRQRPRPDYYDDYEDYYEDEYYDYDDYYDKRPRRKNKGGRRERNKVAAGSQNIESTTNDILKNTQSTTPSTTTTVSTTPIPSDVQQQSKEFETLDIEPSIVSKNREDIFTQSRPPPRIRPPVPKNERNKYDSAQGRAVSSSDDSTSSKSGSSSRTTEEPSQSQSKSEDDEYYDSDDYQTPTQIKNSNSAKITSTTTTRAPAPTTPSAIRQRLFKFGRSSPATSTRSSATTRGTTTTISTTPSTTTTTTLQTTPRPSPPKVSRFTSQSTTTTSTTEAPQYEYEYEYEDDLPSSSSTEKISPPSTTPTTTTTIATTQKPSRNSLRGKRPYGSSSSIQTSTSVTVQESELDSPTSGGSKDDAHDDSQNAINRRLSSWTRSQAQSTGRVPLPSTFPTPNSITSTSERFPSRDTRKQTYQEPVITVKTAPSASPSPSPQAPQYQQTSSRTSAAIVTEAPATRTRPSRFWQRPAKVVASSTTTTEAPLAEYDYQDEPDPDPPIRYTTRSKPSPPSSSTISYTNSGNSEATYATYNTARSPQYSSSSSSSDNDNQQQQYLRPTQNSYRPLAPIQPQRLASSTRAPIDPISHNQNYISAYGPSPSQVGLGHGITSSSSRPEFISLLRDDEDPYYDISPPQPPQQTQVQNPRSRQSSSSISSSINNNNSNSRRLPPSQRTQYFGSQSPPSSYHHHSQSQKNLYGAAQETYHSFLPPPSRYSSNMGFMSDYGYHPPMLFSSGYNRGSPLLGGK